MVKFTRRHEQIKRRFCELYSARYHRNVKAELVGIVLSLLVGELELKTEELDCWPLKEIVPLLRQAVEESSSRIVT